MILLVDAPAIMQYWHKRARLGGVSAWKETDLPYKQLYYIPRFQAGSNKEKQLGDPYFHTWLEDRYQVEGTTIALKHDTWFYGNPQPSAAYLAIRKYYKTLYPPLTDPWRRCQEWLLRKFKIMGDSSINWDIDYLKSMLNKSSSPGYPYNRADGDRPPFSDKRAFLAYQDGEFFKSEVKRYYEAISSREYKAVTFHTLTSKYELRKKKKIQEGNFRGYVAANGVNTAAGIAMCGEMNNKLYEAWGTTPAFIGGSIYHGIWDKLFRRLSKHPNAFECDESNYDTTLSAELIYSLRDTMWFFLKSSEQTEENRIRWDNLFKEIVESLIICPNGDLVRKWQGNPSGCFLTIVINTLILYMLFAYAWLQLCPDETDFDDFDDNVELALCGDDNLGTYSDMIKEWFSTFKVADVWETLGIVVKREAQSEGKLLDRNFLSHRTRMVHGMFMPYPDADKVISSLLRHSFAKHHIRWSYLKACALRMNSYWSEEAREILAGYIAYLERTYMDALTSPRNAKDSMDLFSWEEIRGVYKTDPEIRRMYTMNEGSALNNLAPLNIHFNTCPLFRNAEEIVKGWESLEEERSLYWSTS